MKKKATSVRQTNAIEFLKKNWPFLLFAIVNIVGLIYHECWRDEVQSLLIAKAANGPWDLITRTLRYEGHPALWHLLLRYLTGPGVSPLGMQILNSVLILGTAAIFWWRFPLPFTLRALFLFNYFFVFEYGLLARSYTLGLFLFFFFIAFMDDKRKWLNNLSFAALVLMPQTSVFGAMLALGPMAYLFLRDRKKNLNVAIFRLGLFFCSLLLAAGQMQPPADGAFAVGWNTDFHFMMMLEVLQRFGQVFLFIPQFQGFPLVWDVHLNNLAVGTSRVLFVLMLLTAMTLGFWHRDRRMIFPFWVGFLAFLVFSYTKYLGSIRHGAHVLFLVAGFYWLANRIRPWVLTELQKILLGTVAAMSAVSGLTLWLADVLYPFSDGKQASQALRDNEGFTIAWPDYAGSTLSAYLGGRELFYLEGMHKGTYVTWDLTRAMAKPPSLPDFEAWLREQGKDTVIVATNNLGADPIFGERFKVETLYKSSTCIVPDECYEIMRLTLQSSKRGLRPSTNPAGGQRGVAKDRKIYTSEEAIKLEKKK